ncbi:MAG: PAS domain S-box protein [Coleofasciculaceae cyanobacterium SM2_3_26]|nr:PAS domain S-box protein [Coleofasciculaceae cyanobacterium SM2_3_26]
MHYIQQALKTGEVQVYEQQFDHDEHLQYEEVRVAVSSEDEVLIIVRDITDRKRAEAALRESEATNRAIVRAIPDMLTRVKADGTYTDILSAHHIKVLHPDRFCVGKHVGDSLPAENARQWMQHIQRALQTQEMQVFEQQFVDDSQRQDEEVRIVVIGEGEVLAIVRDITERKKAEESLRIAEENYRSIFENALEGIFQSTPDGHFINVNPAMAQIYGYETPAEMIAGVTTIDTQVYVNPECREEFKRRMQEDDCIKGLEYQIYRKDGSAIWIEESARAVRDDNGKVLYYEGILQDISNRKQKEAELERQLEELRIEIDQKKRAQEVAKITESDYFQELQAEVADLNTDEFWA